MSAYGPEDDEEESDFARLSRELGGVDVGAQEGDADAPPDVADGPMPSTAEARLATAMPEGTAPEAVNKHNAMARDEALASAQGMARKAGRRAQLGRAGSDFIAAMGGYKADDSFWDNAEKQGAKGVGDLKELRASERQTKQDTRQEGLDALNAERVRAQIAKLQKEKDKANAPGRYGALEKVLKLEPGALDGSDAATVKEIAAAIGRGEGAKATAMAKEEERKSQARRDEEERRFKSGESVKDRASREKAAALMAGAKAEKEVEDDVAHVGKDLEGTAALQKSFSSVDDAVDSAGKDIPGIGPWDSRKPEFFDSKSDTVVKQGLKQIIATVLKKQSGSTVSEDEYNRTLSSYGISPTATPAAFKAGYAALKRAAVAAAKEAEARYKPESVDRYRKRGGVTSADFGATPVPPGTNLDNAPTKRINGKTYHQAPDGSWEVEE